MCVCVCVCVCVRARARVRVCVLQGRLRKKGVILIHTVSRGRLTLSRSCQRASCGILYESDPPILAVATKLTVSRFHLTR